MMPPGDYTPDKICRALGLGRFVEDTWRHSAEPNLRVLLTPSFYPEACLTFSAIDAPSLSVVTPREQFWDSDMSYAPAIDREIASISNESRLSLLAEFDTVSAAVRGEYSTLLPYADGMGMETCLVSRHRAEHLPGYPAGQILESFVGRVVDLAWASCQNPYVRNAISRAGGYVGRAYPLDETAQLPPPRHLMVLGPEEERRAYLEKLRARLRAKKANQPPVPL